MALAMACLRACATAQAVLAAAAGFWHDVVGWGTLRMFATLVLNAVLAAASLARAATVAPRVAAPAPAPAVLATPQFRRYGVADGLPSGPVYAVTQDRHGLMWFATASGLVRYDGVSFRVFRHAVDDSQSMPAGAI